MDVDPFDDDGELDDLFISALEDSTGILRSASTSFCIDRVHDQVRVDSSTSTTRHDGFDPDAGRTWIYPTNKEVRQYQYNIVRRALLTNTLVCLPTGLGKTFIAAVVMFNYYRWFPRSKILFMAPTKPLVAQQIEACFEVMGIPQSDMCEMTGTISPNEREIAWREKRVFFLTPQVISNDISRGICPAGEVKCVVVDEAHKALGNHSYVQVVRELQKHGVQFRVLALSATPGSVSSQVQQVINNLLIAHMEIQTDESSDVAPYTHNRVVEKVVIPLGEELTELKAQYLQIVRVYVNRLFSCKALCFANPESLSKFLILKERDRFRQSPPGNLTRTQCSNIERDFAILISLFHGLDLLLFYGMRSFYTHWQDYLMGEKGFSLARYELQNNVTFCRLMDNLKGKFGDAKETLERLRSSSPNLVYSHPKFAKLEEVVVEHFTGNKDTVQGLQDTRAIVFAQYRDIVYEIESLLNRHRPHVRPTVLLGHGTTGGSAKGLNQKHQLEVMRLFRCGTHNVLVSTCVGEEGLDVGDVDLIVCFDAQKSPIRLVQRMGRTGRKRDGRVVVLMAEGKEEKIHVQGQYNNRVVNRAAERSAKHYDLYPNNPRVIPSNVEPVCQKMFLTSGKYVHTEGKVKPTYVWKDRLNVTSPYLDDKQLSEYLHNYFVDDVDVGAQNRVCHMLSLEHAEPVSSSDALSLNDWVLWQTTPNPTFVAGHSEHSKLLVETLNRLQTQSPSVVDDYRVYLDRNDVMDGHQAEVKGRPSKLSVKRKKSSAAAAFVKKSRRSVPDIPQVELMEGEESDASVEMLEVNSDDDLEDFVVEAVKQKEPSPLMWKGQLVDETLLTFFSFAPEMIEEVVQEFVTSPVKTTGCGQWSSGDKFGFDGGCTDLELVTTVQLRKSPRKSVSFCHRTSTRTLSPVPATTPKSSAVEESLYLMTQLMGMLEDSFDSLPSNEAGVEDMLDDRDVIPPSPPPLNPRFKSTVFIRPKLNWTQVKTSSPVKPVVSPNAMLSSPSPDDDDSMTQVRRRGSRRLNRLHFESQMPPMDSSDVEVGKLFLQEEVRVDGVVSSDESVGSANSQDDDFIDDHVFTQVETNMTMYLRSVKSPKARCGAFVLNRNAPSRESNVYSQTPSSSDTDYLEDSFCVGNDVSELLTEVVSSPVFDNRDVITLDRQHSLRENTETGKNDSEPLILVDSREISGSQDVVSELRLKHRARVKIVSLGSCDYLVSKRLAVDRKFISDVANVALKQKLLNRVTGMIESYERPCLIIEKERTRATGLGSKANVNNKHLAGILACFCDTALRIIWTKSQEHTAEVIMDLARHELKSNFAIDVATEPPLTKSTAFEFYRRLLPDNYLAALFFCQRFASVQDFLQSSVEEMQCGGILPQSKAAYIHRKLRQLM